MKCDRAATAACRASWIRSTGSGLDPFFIMISSLPGPAVQGLLGLLVERPPHVRLGVLCCLDDLAVQGLALLGLSHSNFQASQEQPPEWIIRILARHAAEGF